MALTFASDAIDLLTSRDESLRWVEEFRLRGRSFAMVPGGPATFGEGFALFRVWNARGRAVDVKVRPTDKVEVLSRAV